MERPLYELDCELLPPNLFHAKFSELTDPRSLFQALNKKDLIPDGDTDSKQSGRRPLTPVEEAIKECKLTVGEISQLLQKRIAAKTQPVAGLTLNQQQSLLSVVLSEFKSSWNDIKKLAPVPFLANHQNQQIERLMAIEMVEIAEDLYFNTLEKAKVLNDKGVFSSYANNSRLKAQLALQANETLDVVKIHKRLAASMRETPPITPRSSTTDEHKYTARQNTLNTLKRPGIRKAKVKKSVGKLTMEEIDKRQRDTDIVDIKARVPDISVSKVEKTFGICKYDFYNKPLTLEKDDIAAVSEGDGEKHQERSKTISRRERPYQSLPNIMVGESLYEELGIENVKEEGTRRTSVDNLKINLASYGASSKTDDEESVFEKVKKQVSGVVSADLEKLVTEQELEKEKTKEQDEDLSPLLQAMSYSSNKKKKVIPTQNKDDNTDDDDKDEICSTVASSVACDNDFKEQSIPSETELVHEAKQHVQPATVSTRMPDKSVVRTSDVRVSKRVNKSDVTLNTFPTLYNDLVGEIDNVTVKWLDRNLFIGDEVREVYEEIIKTVGTDHHFFDTDPYVEKPATNANLSNVIHSSMLTHGSKADKVINTSLCRDILPPWGQESIDEWRNSPMFGDLGRQDILNLGAQGLTDLSGKVSKSYNSWLAWWRSTITTDDYLKFLSTQDNDYMSLAHHLFDSDENSSDEEGDSNDKPNSRQLKIKRAKEEKLAEIRQLKENYQLGFWNANSVLIGGLGRYPDIGDEELCPDLPAEPSPVEHSEEKYGAEDEETSPLSLQERLDCVWSLLCMPDALRLDMAIKYSSEAFFDKLEEMIVQWEAAVKLILQRESLITRLEDFERLASDPNRFFEKGSGGSASARIKETKARRQFHHDLDNVETRVKKVVTLIYENYEDVVRFQGRPYLDKMSSDRTEMLYWLQQERRENALEMAKTFELIPPIQIDHVL